MKASVVAFTALLGLASAQNAVVKNTCPTAIYVQSFPYDGSAAGPLTTVQPGKSFSEPFRASGSTVKIAKTKTLDKPLFFGYSFSSNPDYAYYEFSTEWGNPFAASHNTLTPGDGCEVFDCQANDANCYSTPAHKKVYGCPQPVNLTAHLCK
uniref:16 kDa allergen n=1 Tax=Photinus pyralis TaxID=7054 RepID=A0A1Y1LFQ4_PHOPY